MYSILQSAVTHAYPIAAIACTAFGIAELSQTEHSKKNILTLIGSIATTAFLTYSLFRAYGPAKDLAAQYTVNLLSKVIVQLTLFCSPFIALNSDFLYKKREYLMKAGIGAAIVGGGALVYSAGALGAARTAQIAGKLFLHLGVAPIIGGATCFYVVMSVAGAAMRG